SFVGCWRSAPARQASLSSDWLSALDCQPFQRPSEHGMIPRRAAAHVARLASLFVKSFLEASQYTSPRKSHEKSTFQAMKRLHSSRRGWASAAWLAHSLPPSPKSHFQIPNVAVVHM